MNDADDDSPMDLEVPYFQRNPYQIPSGKRANITNWKDPPCYQWVNPLFLWPFSIAIYIYICEIIPLAPRPRLRGAATLPAVPAVPAVAPLESVAVVPSAPAPAPPSGRAQRLRVSGRHGLHLRWRPGSHPFLLGRRKKTWWWWWW